VRKNQHRVSRFPDQSGAAWVRVVHKPVIVPQDGVSFFPWRRSTSDHRAADPCGHVTPLDHHHPQSTGVQEVRDVMVEFPRVRIFSVSEVWHIVLRQFEQP
jgi:hypothetical protein